MKLLLGFLAIVFLAHHFLKEDSSASGSHAGVDFPGWFTPDEWSSEQRADYLKQCRDVHAELEEFIENPPTYT